MTRSRRCRVMQLLCCTISCRMLSSLYYYEADSTARMKKKKDVTPPTAIMSWPTLPHAHLMFSCSISLSPAYLSLSRVLFSRWVLE